MPLTRRDAIRLAIGAGVAQKFTGWNHLFAQTRRPVPTASQLAWQQDELAMFIHFGVNTFTNREWGDGKEDPAIFIPTKLDALQWARAANEAGFKAMVLTAKHHDGFCLWPTKTTRHSVASSPFRGGKGDVVREFVDACRLTGLKVGLYCSPWDRHEPTYGDSPRYNDLFCDQLTELLTQYGPVHEVWFDGANGEGPNGRKQEYDWPRFWAHVRKLQPEAVMFSDAGPDIRWIGNERGVAGDTNWSTVDPSVVPVPGMSGDAVMKMLQDGDPAGSVWRPGETDVSIRPGWFYHPAEDTRVKTVDQLVELYFTSVGRNSKLLLNVPPTPDGLLHQVDVERLIGMKRELNRHFSGHQNAISDSSSEATMNPARGVYNLKLMAPLPVSILDVREDITRGQVVSRYVIEGANGEAWTTLARGTTVGYKRLHRIPTATVERLRLTVEEALGEPAGMELHAWHQKG
jgi:alpha-L-fucosidase